jgi:hypothetical protein
LSFSDGKFEPITEEGGLLCAVVGNQPRKQVS